MKLKTTLAALSALALLGASGAMANGTQPDTPPASPQQQVGPPQVAPGVPMVPVWVQLPAAGSYPYFLMPPQPVPAYPLPQMTLPSGWGPFVMVWVPVQALQAVPVPPVVDYGPVADTPVVVLPEPESEPEPEPTPVAAVPGATQPAVAAPARVNIPDANPAQVPEVAVPVVAPVAATPPLEEAVAESVPASAPAVDVDYGPVAPTPVVELPDFTAQPIVVAPAQPPAKAKKKPAARNKPANLAPAAAAPAKKRLCWNNGVVAPCR